MKKEILIPEIVNETQKTNKLNHNIGFNFKRISNKKLIMQTTYNTTSNSHNTNITNNNLHSQSLFSFFLNIVKLPFIFISWLFKKITNDDLKQKYKEYKAVNNKNKKEQRFYKKMKKINEMYDEY